MPVAEILATNPQHPALDPADLVAAIEAAQQCALSCTACADACLAEDELLALRRCIRRTLDCADLCTTTARVLTRQVGVDLGLVRVLLEACVVACKRCAAECEDHAGMHVHCAVCAQDCRDAEQACRLLLESLRDRAVPQPEPVGATVIGDEAPETD